MFNPRRESFCRQPLDHSAALTNECIILPVSSSRLWKAQFDSLGEAREVPTPSQSAKMNLPSRFDASHRLSQLPDQAPVANAKAAQAGLQV